MCSRFLSLLLAALLPCAAADQRVLRVCADPNNLPFSNERGEGFENRLAQWIAYDLGARLEYTWWSERKSFIKNSLDEGRCDVLMGIPTALPSVSVTKPYYTSTYVFVSRKDRDLRVTSLGDARLAQWRIGMHVVGDDYAPPAHALARRGLSANLAGYSLFGKQGEENPPARIIDAVAHGDVDIAVVWGPFAGYFAQRSTVPLDIVPVSPAMFLSVPFTYDMSLGVRKGDEALRSELDRALEQECAAIQALLVDYGIPQVKALEGKTSCEPSQRPRSAFSR